MIRAIDQWAGQNATTRSGAIRKFVEQGLGILPAKEITPERAMILAAVERAGGTQPRKGARREAEAEKIGGHQMLTREMRAHIERVLDYLANERKDYGDDPRQGHVYESVLEIRLWLDSLDGNPKPLRKPPPKPQSKAVPDRFESEGFPKG